MTDTPKAAKPAGREMREPQTLPLKKSGITVVFDAGYVAADSIAAQRAAGKDSTRYPLYLMQRICAFDGAAWSVQQIEEKLPGMDYLTLQGAIFGAGDEDAAGN